jgi:predicted DNA-binding transcriptional regulator AlpA
MQYHFSLNYRLSSDDSDMDEIVERLGAAGCDDALVGTGLPWRLGLDFIREAESAEAAMVSALEDIKRAIPTAHLIEAVPDIVGLSDAADVVGVTRQNLHKLMRKHQSSFPAPVHAGSTSVWHLEDLVVWLTETMSYEVEACTLDVAKIAKQVNLAKEAHQLTPRMGKNLKALVA